MKWISNAEKPKILPLMNTDNTDLERQETSAVWEQRQILSRINAEATGLSSEFFFRLDNLKRSGSTRHIKGEPDHAASPLFQEQNIRTKFEKISSGLSRSDQNDEKAVRQQDGLLFQGRIVPTEFRKDHQNSVGTILP